MKQVNAIHKLSGRLLFQQILPRIARILLFSECKKISILLILFAVILQYSQAQNFQFEQILPLPPEPQNLVPFDGVGGIGENRIAYADIDGDNDQDVLITGMCYSEIIAKLYTNDGNGSYTEVEGTPFEGVRDGSVAFADIDGDNDQDVLITGGPTQYTADLPSSRLYTNDGHGNFTEVSGTPFLGVTYGSIAFTDIDGDNDQDVIILGMTKFPYCYAKLYINDGGGNFTENTGASLGGTFYGTLDISDVDGDSDPDVLITGRAGGTGGYVSKLYINDGTGNFTLKTGTPFVGVYLGSAAFSDIDGDNDPDVLITGAIDRGFPYRNKVGLYINDGSGNFSAVGNPFQGVDFSSVAFSDIDNDNDQDVIITGRNNERRSIAELFTNDGLGNFTEVSGTPFHSMNAGSVVFYDIDSDNDPDLLTSGSTSMGLASQLFVNDGQGNYTEALGSALDRVAVGSAALSDVDGDNDQDALITGLTKYNYPDIELISKLYTNDGLGNLTEVIGTPFDDVFYSATAFADVDNDNDQDVLITGRNSNNLRIAKLYINDGSGTYTEDLGTPFAGVELSAIAFSDIDGDSDQDLLITGYDASSQTISKLYINDGMGNFSEVIGTPFVGVRSGSIAFSDVDGDNDQDVLITGNSGEPEWNSVLISKLYKNDGFGNFSEVFGTPFVGVNYSSVAFEDIDGDNDQDVIITGKISGDMDWEPRLITKLYKNDGSGNFSLVSGTPFEAVHQGSVAFSDFDGDLDQDVLITGEYYEVEEGDGWDYYHNKKMSKIYTNDGLGNFTEEIYTPIEEVSSSSIAIADIDGDTDPDILIRGRSYSGEITRLYRNLTVSVCVPAELIPDQPELPDITAECEVTSAESPTATNNCGEQFTGTTNTEFPITSQGTTVIVWTYDDGSGNTLTQEQNVVIDDITPPIIISPASDIIQCDTPSDPAATGAAAATDNCDDDPIITFADLVTTGECANESVITRTWTAVDAYGNSASAIQIITVQDDVAPIISGVPSGPIVQGNDPGQCGAVINYPVIVATDNCSGDVNITVEPASGSFFPVGSTMVNVSAVDECGNSTSESFEVVVTNTIPDIISIAASLDPIQVNTTVYISALSSDNNLESAVWEWGDGSYSEGTIGTEILGEHVYTSPGVYTVTLTLTDLCGAFVSSEYQYVVIYDPEGGFVTGGGWINSPVGASVQYPDAVGKANFGFVSKYKKGATVPTGNTEFQFKAGDLNFNSYVYDWLVIAGARAKFKGEGTINGSGEFGFMISAIDGDLNDTGEDMFRIKIWDKLNSDLMVYDNQMGDSDDADPTAVLGGGSIVIHDGNVKKSSVIEANPSISEVKIYPNPFDNFIHVDLMSKKKDQIIIDMVDMNGRIIDIIYSGIVEANVDHHFELSTISDLVPGMYMIRIRSNDGTGIVREMIIKQ